MPQVHSRSNSDENGNDYPNKAELSTDKHGSPKPTETPSKTSLHLRHESNEQRFQLGSPLRSLLKAACPG
jgi:hypothetical protein